MDAADIDWAVRTPDIDQFGRAVARRLKPFRFLSPARDGYDAALFFRPIAASEVILLRYGQSVTIDAGRLQGLSLLQVPLTGSYSLHRRGGTTVIPTRTAHLLPAGAPLVMEWSADCLLMVVRLDQSVGSAHAGAADQTVRLDQPEGAALGHYIDFLLAEVTGGALLAGSPEMGRSAEALLAALLDARFGAAPPAARRAGIRRAEALLAGAEPLPMATLAQASGYSRRTLYRRFREAHGTTPMAWRRHAQLARAREALLATDPGTTSVTDVALAHGFSHFGRFASAYHAAFGERPSDSLSRPAP